MQFEEGERDLVWEDGSEVRAPRSQFEKIILMMSFTAHAHVHTGSVRRPRRALRDDAHRRPAVRHHGVRGRTRCIRRIMWTYLAGVGEAGAGAC